MIVLPEKTKSLFGEIPSFYQKRVLNWKRRKNIEKDTFLIVDGLDGKFGMCPLRNNINVTIFEQNNLFIDGGRIEVPVKIKDEYIFLERKINGIKDRVEIEVLNKMPDIINMNFYEVDNYEQYSYVVASKSLSRIENSKYSMDYKINKLKNSVNQNGYLYLEYYVALNNDEELYPSNLYLKKEEILKYFPKDEWTILLNEINVVKEELTPLNREEKEVLIGYLDVRKKKTPTKRVYKHYKSYIDDTIIRVNHKYIINGVTR